ncbi:hypothetical protein [uncultured Brevundimonas sp.]|uniref:hypothetical protein n=1 Tax=uncultured Brevundimonas sp. TaxID=213418 RepID=UPI0030EDF728|tara:strand:- start:19982 stop:20659 length:678 start_codon:yes stop_codon:yes gene_type:complete
MDSDGLMRRERGRRRLEMAGLTATTLGLLTLGVTVAAGDALGPHDDAVFGGGLALMVGGAVTVLAAWRPRADRQALRARETRRDRTQRARARQLVGLSFGTVGMLIVSTLAVWRVTQGTGDRHDLMFAALAALMAWMVSLIVMGWDGGSRRDRKWLEDELTREWRGRAMALGFLVLLAGMSGLYLIGLWRPELAMIGFPAVLMGSGAAAGLRFAWLDHQAEAGDA